MRDATRDHGPAGARRERALWLVAIAAWALFAARLLASGFRADDWTFLAHVRSAGSWIDLVTPSGHFAFFRPAALLLFRSEHAVFGLNAAGYLLVNVLLHAANAALGACVLVHCGASRRQAQIAAALFLVGVGHLGKQIGWACASGPLASVTACLASMAAAGALLRGGSGRRAVPVLVGGFLLAPLLHESGALAPLLVGLVLAAAAPTATAHRSLVRQVAAVGARVSVGWILVLVSLRAQYPAYPGALENVARAPWLLWRYLGFLLFPVQPQQWSGAPVVHAFLGTLLVAGAVACFRRVRLQTWRGVALLWIWMFAALLPYGLVPMPGLWLEPRYVYFASLPLCGLLVLGFEHLPRRFALLHRHAWLERAASVALLAGLLLTIALQMTYAARRQALAGVEESRGLADMASTEHAWRTLR